MISEFINWETIIDVSLDFVPGALLGTIVMAALWGREQIQEEQKLTEEEKRKRRKLFWIDILLSLTLPLIATIIYVKSADEKHAFVFHTALVFSVAGTSAALYLRKKSISVSKKIIDSDLDQLAP